MGRPAYLHGNSLLSAIVEVSSEDSIYVAENLWDEVLGYTFRFADGSGGIIDIDAGEDADDDTLAILNHNFMADAVIRVGSGAAPAPATTVVPWREEDILVYLTPDQRYHRIVVEDTNALFTEIGQIVLRKRTTLTSQMAYGFNRKPGREKLRHTTVRGVKHVYTLYNAPSWEAVFLSVQDWHIEELDLLDKLVRGSELPFVWIPCDDFMEAWYVRKEDEHRVQSVRFNEWNVTLILEAESRGLNVL